MNFCNALSVCNGWKKVEMFEKKYGHHPAVAIQRAWRKYRPCVRRPNANDDVDIIGDIDATPEQRFMLMVAERVAKLERQLDEKDAQLRRQQHVNEVLVDRLNHVWEHGVQDLHRELKWSAHGYLQNMFERYDEVDDAVQDLRARVEMLELGAASETAP